MRVYLDDKEVQISRPTIAAAMEEVRKIAEQRKRVIVEATLDGLPLPDEALANPPEDEYPDAELRLVTDEPIELVRRTLGQVADSLDETRSEQAQAAELIQTGRLEEAMRRLSSSLHSWGNVQQVVSNSVMLLGLPLDELRVGDRRVSSAVDSLASRLGEVKRSISAQDWSGLADALAYDMQEQAAAWQAMLNGLSDMIGKAGEKPGPTR